MPKNSDGTVTLKTTGKLATNPSGSGTGIVKNAAAKSSPKSPTVVKKKGQGPAPKSALAH